MPSFTFKELRNLYIDKIENNEHNDNFFNLCWNTVENIHIKEMEIENFLMLKRIKSSIIIDKLTIGGKSVFKKSYQASYFCVSQLRCVFNSLEEKRMCEPENLKKFLEITCFCFLVCIIFNSLFILVYRKKLK